MKKILFLFFLTLLLCTSSAAQKKVSYQRDYRYLVERIDGVYIPKDIDEAIDSLDVINKEKAHQEFLDDIYEGSHGF